MLPIFYKVFPGITFIPVRYSSSITDLRTWCTSASVSNMAPCKRLQSTGQGGARRPEAGAVQDRGGAGRGGVGGGAGEQDEPFSGQRDCIVPSAVIIAVVVPLLYTLSRNITIVWVLHF